MLPCKDTASVGIAAIDEVHFLNLSVKTHAPEQAIIAVIRTAFVLTKLRLVVGGYYFETGHVEEACVVPASRCQQQKSSGCHLYTSARRCVYLKTPDSDAH